METPRLLSVPISRCVSIGFISFVLVSLLYGCASPKLVTETMPLSGDASAEKDIFVFLDGTGNNPGSETNVWKLYQLLTGRAEPQTVALYVAGVGSAEDAPPSESVLGRGMEPRILKGYAFISEHYTPGDRIFLFGFSRGAHQARALAGLISYAGLLQGQGVDTSLSEKNADRVIELAKEHRDEDFAEFWQAWRPGQAPPMAPEIAEKLELATMPGEITFLGVWDTVPGSSLKGYGVCKEEIGMIKQNGWLFFGVSKGERYKSDSYPPIRHIAHAVSLDEKRSKFRPLLICSPIQQALPRVDEVWFPGAHADVGGGYEDSDALPLLSLNWMVKLLGEYYQLPMDAIGPGNPLGLAHWSIGDRPANLGSDCEDRQPETTGREHPSAEQRRSGGPVPIRWHGQTKLVAYPVDCQGSGAL